MSSYVVPMSQALDPALVGGKGGKLGRLIAAGFSVPRFLVITPNAFDADGPLADAAKAVRASLLSLGPGPFAVRSSAREEDGASHSHAGQFLSLLEVDVADVLDAAFRVWRSSFSEHVAAYRTARGIAADPRGLAVVVQEMVPAQAAGVAFSADPVSGRRDVTVINATAGIGDKLANGEVTGDTFHLGRTGHVVRESIAGNEAVISRDDVRRVADLAVAVECALGGPQDIEWAIDRGRLFLLQARPITTLMERPVADETLTIFDNSNIVESYPGLVSPLTYSFARNVYGHVYRALVRLLGVPDAMIHEHRHSFENLLGRLDGRLYYNLLHWYRVLLLLPGFRLNRGFMETMMGVGEALPADVADRLAPPRAMGIARILELARVARVAAGLIWNAVRLPHSIRRFELRLETALGDEPNTLGEKPLTSLAGEYRALETALLERWDAPLVNDLMCMIAFGASRKLMQRWAGDEGARLHNDVLIGQGDIVSAEPAQRIRAMGQLAARNTDLIARLATGDRSALEQAPELAQDVAAYLAKFGDRCTAELKLESIPLSDDPKPLLKAIAAAGRSDRAAAPQRADLNRQLVLLLAGRPLRRWMARQLLSWTKSRIRDRENLRFQRTRLFGRVRRIVIAIGRELAAQGHLSDQRDVFLLTIEELLGAIEGLGTTDDLAGLVSLRKAEMNRFGHLPDPPERIELRGAFVNGRRVVRASEAGFCLSTERTGIGCSAGTVRGAARIIRDPRQDVVEPNEIMVARHTDPGWIALFANAAGIVVERGSLLSHSAIVAREMGIPCVVGLKGALDWIEGGETIEVNGGTGLVRKING